MDLSLNEQTAIVVGGASGIGLAIAEAFATEGAQVGIIDRDAEGLDALSNVETFEGDIASAKSMIASRKHFIKKLGRIDHVVVAAANSSGKVGFPFWNLKPSDWPRVLGKIAPLGEWQTPPEFGAMATFLASPHARNITGQTLNIDGGQVMHS